MCGVVAKAENSGGAAGEGGGGACVSRMHAGALAVNLATVTTLLLITQHSPPPFLRCLVFLPHCLATSPTAHTVSKNRAPPGRQHHVCARGGAGCSSAALQALEEGGWALPRPGGPRDVID